jgi:thiamine-monophosphate kinase
LGGAAAALKLLFSGRKLRPAHFPSHFNPIPRVEVGEFLRERGLATAMIDLSDGLSTDLGHICDESAVGAEISADAIPLAQIDKPARKVNLQSALHGGDDYELLFTAPKAKRVPSRIAGVDITQIGQITRGRQAILITSGGGRIKLRPQGWEHFKG